MGISHRKSTEVINITWFGHNGFLLLKTSQELRMLSPSLSIQRSQCNCPYCCSQLLEMKSVSQMSCLRSQKTFKNSENSQKSENIKKISKIVKNYQKLLKIVKNCQKLSKIVKIVKIVKIA